MDIGLASRILRDALKDKSYRSTPLGLEVARYIRWKRNEWGATTETIRDYESILARLALFFADLEIKDFETPVGAERLRECWDHLQGSGAGVTSRAVVVFAAASLLALAAAAGVAGWLDRLAALVAAERLERPL